MFGDPGLDVGIDGGVRQSRNGDAAWKAGRAGTDLIQGKWGDGGYHCGNLFSSKALQGTVIMRFE
jgi:hypothetical protein